ncbi:NADPH-dependent FMN reductase [Rhodococcus artemisiae]|uniref:NADPH-dependent FMN reductase n=1 Tax=Rhodococcus artemisiae TaxID=714159 RepID=A0ABU7LFT5_9NOCA|nr:NADPH-dependent FMN reductase [Rhodococcus artemisiae]MEE2060405.1 NADPH-dependent FMN reductase [Rhodococcus artemisiae]
MGTVGATTKSERCSVRGSIDLVNLLLLSGSTRAKSTNAAALASVAASAPPTATTTIYRGLSALPAFNPDDDHDPLPDEVSTLRQLIRAADAVLFCTPEYAGTLPGSFKNLLDWTVGGTEMADKPVAWINVAAPGRGHGAGSTLETVLGYVGAQLIPTACISAPVGRDDVDDDGVIRNVEISRTLAQIWVELRRQ